MVRVNVGDVVLAEYRNFDDDLVKAMFVVFYHECDDIPGSSNFLGIKVASNPRGFQINILKDQLNHLDKDSYINCNRIFPLREDRVYKIIGSLNVYYMNKLFIQLNNCLDRAKSQTASRYGEQNMFDQNKPQIFKVR